MPAAATPYETRGEPATFSNHFKYLRQRAETRRERLRARHGGAVHLSARRLGPQRHANKRVMAY